MFNFACPFKFMLAGTLLCLTLLNSNLAHAESSAAQLTIDVPFVELHSGPSAGYPVVHVVEQHEQVSVLLKRTSWLKVRDKRGIEGWFHEDDLRGLSQHGEAINQHVIGTEAFMQRDWEAGVMYGDLEGANFYNVHLGYVFTPVFSAEISAGKALGSISDSDLFEAMLYSHPFPEFTLVPYIGIGGGIINTKPHSVIADSESRQSTLMSAAAGVKYHLARNFILRAEYKLSLALTDRDENEQLQSWKVGFSVFF
ncbi:SH3 domain-containing protein [Shewanella sp. 10N.7]|uniref:SH3 domain-containing protein n=1 Tax=Shewanella sp. 10N.7 TaxID=2885093 RepID=UPI001E3167FA|nr:SH3 domain-containing protein [Shewanella sp. 10N.7]MCC4833630.1 SH3 domain-containing protein [Shewanella sp. 10N.7]